MPSVFVTGGSGFLGLILLERLLAQGHDVTSIDLLPCAIAHPRLRSFVGDIRDRALLDTALTSADHAVVFHCAALLAHGALTPQAVWTNNVDGTRMLAAAVAARNIHRVVYISSNCLWGKSFDRPVREDDVPEPVELYGASKWEGEKILAAHAGDFATTVLRCPTIMDSGRLGLLSILFEFMAEDRRIWVVGNGSNRYQFVFAQDLVAAMLLAWHAERAGVYGIGSDNVPSMRQLYEYVIANSGRKSKIGQLPQRPTILAMQVAHRLGVSPLGPYHYRMIASDFIFDTTRIKQDLGWRPTLTNQEMLLLAYRSYAADLPAIRMRRDVSAHRQPARMGIIRALKWMS